MRRVLILEREAFLGKLLSERFKRSGFEVRLLQDASPAALADLYRPDLIIVGGHEPGGLRDLHRWAIGTPVIVLGDEPSELPRWLFPTLEKPFSPNQLVELAQQYLLARQLERSSGRKVGIIPIS